MKFDPIFYMIWAKTKPSVAVNLSFSGLESPTFQELEIDPGQLQLAGSNRYGYLQLLEAIASRYQVAPENVCLTLGTSQAVFLICAAICNPGDEVLVEAPAYEPLWAVPQGLGARIIRFKRPHSSAYRLDPAEAASHISDRTRLVILTNPHNPSGVLLPEKEIREFMDYCGEKGVMVLIDEVYREFAEPRYKSSFTMGTHVIAAASLTKVFGFGGLRCGWVIAEPSLIRRLKQICDHMHIEHVFIAEQIASLAFPKLDMILERNRPRLENNLRLVRGFIANEPNLTWVEPSIGAISFPRVESLPDSDKLFHLLLEEYDTLVVPGRFFEEPRHFRLGNSGPTEILKKGLQNLHAAIERLSVNTE